MAETTTMTLPPGLQVKNHHQSQSGRQTVSILAIAPTLSQSPSEAGATVYVAGSNTCKTDSASVWHSTITEVQPSNGYSGKSKIDYPAHVVKIKINPEYENSQVISSVHLTPEDSKNNEKTSVNLTKNQTVNDKNIANGRTKLDSCVRISVVNDTEKESRKDHNEMVQKVETDSMNGNNRSCFYYGYQNQISTMVMSSGQCSPSDTLDSGTCSDLDGTPPPLPKKKNSSTILLGGNSGVKHKRTGSLTSSGADIDSDDNESNLSCDSLNSGELSGRINEQPVETSLATVVAESCGQKDSCIIKTDTIKTDNQRIKRDLETTADELQRICLNNNNEDVNKNYDDRNTLISNDKLSLIDVTSPCISPSQSGTSSLSKSSSTPRVRSPNPLANGQQQQQQQQQHASSTSPVVKECTYEDRKKELDRIEQENAAAVHYANYNRDNGTKYVYEDDRFYKFHINEFNENNEDIEKRGNDDNEHDEYFAGYKIRDREAIRSAKGTVRGVKNRVRAGIATFLQNPSSKNYKQKDAGKVVVYTTSMRVVRKTTIACVKMLRILGTHLVQCEERDLFTSREFQNELKERLGIETVDVPQLFIDGQHIGDADAVERLNESGELRPMLKPYKCPAKRQVCPCCGGAGIVPCSVCNGSKKSPRWNNFMNEFVALRCMNCDEVGLTRCQYCKND